MSINAINQLLRGEVRSVVSPMCSLCLRPWHSRHADGLNSRTVQYFTLILLLLLSWLEKPSNTKKLKIFLLTHSTFELSTYLQLSSMTNKDQIWYNLTTIYNNLNLKQHNLEFDPPILFETKYKILLFFDGSSNLWLDLDTTWRLERTNPWLQQHDLTN